MDLQLTKIPVAEAGMLIRMPALEVYEAFAVPAITPKLWFTKSRGRLEVGKHLRWYWEMYEVCSTVEVKALEPGKRILIEWTANSETTAVEWNFTAHEDGNTFVSITDSGFIGNGDNVMQAAKGGKTSLELVLAGLKSYLEHGIQPNLVAIRYPNQLVNPPSHLRDGRSWTARHERDGCQPG
jgi:uncharacterized protein YndB with AHSA1/START domain